MVSELQVTPRAIGLVFAASALVSAIVFIAVAVQNTAEVSVLLSDPSASVHAPWYLGAVSSLGVAGWMVATVCFAVATFVRRRMGLAHLPFLCGTLVSAMLWADDLYLLHERVFHNIIGSEKPTLALYAVAVPLWVWSVRHVVSDPVLAVGVGSLAALGLSVAVDVLIASDAELRSLAEDGFKFLGICLWASFAAAALSDVLGELAASDRWIPVPAVPEEPSIG